MFFSTAWAREATETLGRKEKRTWGLEAVTHIEKIDTMCNLKQVFGNGRQARQCRKENFRRRKKKEKEIERRTRVRARVVS